MKLAFEQKVARAVVGYSLAIFLFVAFCSLLFPSWFPAPSDLSARHLALIALVALLYTFSCIYLVWRVIRDRSDMIRNLLTSDRDPRKVRIPFDEYRQADERYRAMLEKQDLLEIESTYKARQIADLRERHRSLTDRIEERRAEAVRVANELNDSANSFVQIMNSMDSLVWITDYEGELQYVNQKLRQMIPGIELHKTRLDDILDATEGELNLLRRRDFSNVAWRLRDSRRSAYIFNSMRHFEGNTINRLMFVADRHRSVYRTSEFIRINKNLNFINEISELIGRENNSAEYIQRILEKIGVFCQLTALTIRLRNKHDPLNLELYSIYQRKQDHISDLPYPMENSHVGLCYTSGSPILLNEVDDLLLDEPRMEEMLLHGLSVGLFPLKIQHETIGILGVIHEKHLDKELLLLINSVAINLTIALEKVLLIDELKKNYFKTVEAFLAAFEMKVNYLPGHSRRVAQLALMMAEQLYFSPDDRDNLYISALLHDVGKLAFDDRSVEALFDTEQHGVIGRRMIERVGFPRDVCDGIEFHHSDYFRDGSIQPLYAQFIRLANDFDIYFHIAPRRERAEKFLSGLSEREYSPQLVDVLLDILRNRFELLSRIYGGIEE